MSRRRVVGVLLAGGRARRMGGGDKCLRSLGGRTLLARASARLGPQVDALVLNANGDPARFAGHGLPVVADPLEGFLGPLVGVLAGMRAAGRVAPEAGWILTAPTDAPFLPGDTRARLEAALDAEGAEIAIAASDGRRHPVVGLWPVALAEALQAAVADERVRKVEAFTDRYRTAQASWSSEPVDPFFNVNREGDLAEAERLLTAGKAPD